jgi:hypothetical protein
MERLEFWKKFWWVMGISFFKISIITTFEELKNTPIVGDLQTRIIMF